MVLLISDIQYQVSNLFFVDHIFGIQMWINSWSVILLVSVLMGDAYVNSFTRNLKSNSIKHPRSLCMIFGWVSSLSMPTRKVADVDSEFANELLGFALNNGNRGLNKEFKEAIKSKIIDLNKQQLSDRYYQRINPETAERFINGSWDLVWTTEKVRNGSGFFHSMMI